MATKVNTTKVPAKSFDYESMDKMSRVMVQNHTTEIRERVGRAAQNVYEIGERLLAVKALLEHGQFLGWLETEFAWSERAARRMMEVATIFKTANLADLQVIAPSALYLLASDSTSPAIRNQFMDKAANGEAVTHAAVADAIKSPAPAKPRNIFDDDEPEVAAEKKTPQAKPEPAKAKPVVDEVGNVIERKEVIDLFLRAGEIETFMRQMSAVKSTPLNAAESGDKLYQFLDVAGFRAAAGNVYRILKFAVPYALCPYCGDDKSTRRSCKCCGGAGWVPKDKYDRAPESMRKGAK